MSIKWAKVDTATNIVVNIETATQDWIDQYEVDNPPESSDYIYINLEEHEIIINSTSAPDEISNAETFYVTIGYTYDPINMVFEP